MSAQTCQSGRHVIRDQRDRVANGACRLCHYQNVKKYEAEQRQLNRAAREVVERLLAEKQKGKK